MNFRRIVLFCGLSLVLGSPAFAVAEIEPSAEMETDYSTGSVSRSAVTRGIVDREPQDELTRVGNDLPEIFYFTELRDLEGDTVVHRWEWNGQVMAEVSFQVGGPRWRVNSSKSLDASWLGQWSVSVLDGAGQVLSQQEFEVVEAAAEPVAPPPAAIQPE